MDLQGNIDAALSNRKIKIDEHENTRLGYRSYHFKKGTIDYSNLSKSVNLLKEE